MRVAGRPDEVTIVSYGSLPLLVLSLLGDLEARMTTYIYVRLHFPPKKNNHGSDEEGG